MPSIYIGSSSDSLSRLIERAEEAYSQGCNSLDIVSVVEALAEVGLMLSQGKKVVKWVEAVAQKAAAYVEETRALLARPAMEAMPSQARLYRQALQRVEALLARRPEFEPGPAFSLADRRAVEAWAGEVEDALSHHSARGGNRE